MGFEFRAYTLSHSTSPFFVMGFFKIGSLELFAWAGFKPEILLISALSSWDYRPPAPSCIFFSFFPPLLYLLRKSQHY
jgi:hypothetical protein